MTEDDRQESDGERELSDSDSEPELDPAEYEKRRELCLRQIILAEIQFNKLKIVLRDLKIKQLMKRRQDVINQTDPEFVVKHRELLEEFSTRNKLTEAIRCLEMDSLERRTTGLKRIAEMNQDDNKIIAKEKLREEIENEIRVEKERRIHERIATAYLLDDSCDRYERKRTNEYKNRPYNVKRYRPNFPVVIHQLTQDQIEADLRSMDLAILISNIKEEEESKNGILNADFVRFEVVWNAALHPCHYLILSPTFFKCNSSICQSFCICSTSALMSSAAELLAHRTSASCATSVL